MKSRPLSPHLQVYRPQITSILSILHRCTGIAISISLIVFAAGLYSFSLGETSWNSFVCLWYKIGGKIWQWPLIFSLHYHAFNGIRHLFWDCGKGFEIATVTKTGFFVLLLSLISTYYFATFCSLI
jgi:succinate dehydrogenase / fumarate reductase cytochrome b subunit